MTYKTRLILFSFFVVLFFLIIIPLIFYSQGYRFDFQKKEMVKTGGIFLKTSQSLEAEVFLNGKKIKKKITPLFHRVLIQNLIPKTYDVELKKENYHSWIKNLRVEEEMVSEAKNILLVPKNPQKNILFKNIEKFKFSPNEAKIALVINTEDGKKISVLDINSNKEKQIADNFSEISEIKWSPDSQKLLFWADKKWQLVNLKEGSLKITALKNIPSLATNLNWHPQEKEKIIFLSEKTKGSKKLVEFNLENSTITSTLISNLDFYDIEGSEIYWLEENTDLIFKINGQGTKKQLTYSPLSLREKNIKFIFFNDGFGILNKTEIFQENNFYLFDSENNLLKEIHQPVKDAKISGDEKKILLFSEKEIWVYWLDDILIQPYHYKDDKEFITRFSKNIGQAIWYPDGEHILFTIEDDNSIKIKITELDSRDPRNIVDFLEYNSIGNFDFYYNSKYKNLYILAKNSLIQIKFPKE